MVKFLGLLEAPTLSVFTLKRVFDMLKCTLTMPFLLLLGLDAALCAPRMLDSSGHADNVINLVTKPGNASLKFVSTAITLVTKLLIVRMTSFAVSAKDLLT